MDKIKKFVGSALFMQILFSALVVAAVVGVAYGWLTHEEPGFMDEAPVWSAMPLTVCPGAYAPHDAETQLVCEGATEGAVATINTRLGFRAYRVEPLTASRTCEVELVCGYPADRANELGGSAHLEPSRCDVRIVNVRGELQALAIEHELGHCLGLADDGDANPQSIMRSKQVATPHGELPPWISDHDREILRALYVR